MKIDFAGKVALVAGGAGGLGHAVSLAFVEEGAKVVVPYRTEAEFAELKRAAGQREAQLIGRAVDVLDQAAVARLIEETGPIDVLVNTVGAYGGGVELWKLAAADFDRMLDLNLRSGFVLAKTVLPGMLQRGRGAVVNVSAKAALDHGAGASAYAASNGFARCRDARNGCACELRAAEHHRHEGESRGDAGCEVRYMAEARGYCEGDSVPRERRGEGGARRGSYCLWRQLSAALMCTT
jgi:NADP-dependent 3-hydroxy acid dehydrogenase YdfG